MATLSITYPGTAPTTVRYKPERMVPVGKKRTFVSDGIAAKLMQLRMMNDQWRSQMAGATVDVVADEPFVDQSGYSLMRVPYMAAPTPKAPSVTVTQTNDRMADLLAQMRGAR